MFDFEVPKCRAASLSAVSLNDQSSKSLHPFITSVRELRVKAVFDFEVPKCRAASLSAVSLNDQSSKSLHPFITSVHEL